MQAKTALYALSSLIILPVLYLFFWAIHIAPGGQSLEHWVPRWDRLLILVTIIALERIYTYRHAVSQRAVLPRDIIANVVNLYITGAVAAMLVLPLLKYLPAHFLGRPYFFASPEQLGPFWLQIVAILVVVSFFRYWMHRMQHEIGWMWELHSYHHRVTDLTATNGEVSNPVDFALRNIVIFLALGIAGFDPVALLFAVTVANVTAVFSHCAADIRSGPFNYIFVTPEVHRWHHSAKTPEGYGYACNYGVEFSFWDAVFGTLYLPHKDGQVVPPERIGHPGGLPDEPNYLKILLMPLGLYGIVAWLKRLVPMPKQTQNAAE